MERQQAAADQALPFRDVYTVSRLNREVKRVLELGFASAIWVEGEISNLSRPASGHLYFHLKDDQAQVRCVLFRNTLRHITADPADGMHALVRGRASLYDARGQFQLIIDHLEDAGEGARRRAFEALKQRLEKEGLFEAAGKKPLPRLPQRIGILTSPSGAVLHDVLTTLKRRFPAIPVLLYPVPVQGEGAAEKIVAALDLASRRRDCDALILTRGGGSLEDLWAFNEEIVARAIHRCAVPVVCAVGHETDFTIADLAADVRAPTPTAAAELLSPDQHEWLLQFRNRESRLVRLTRDRIQNLAQRLDWLGARVIHPRQRLGLLQQRLHDLGRRLRLAQGAVLQNARARESVLSARLHRLSPQARIDAMDMRFHYLSNRLLGGIRRAWEHSRHRLQQAAQGLHALSPLATLARGYAIVQRQDDGTVVRDTATMKQGEKIDARLARGRLQCTVDKVHED